MFGLRLIQNEGADRIHNNSKGIQTDAFEKFFFLRNDNIPYCATWAWHPKNVFVGLNPWINVEDFGNMCDRLISCALECGKDPTNKGDKEKLQQNLEMALNLIDSHLPKPPPKFSVPWGYDKDWRIFSMNMPEAIVAISIALNSSQADGIAEKLLRQYLPKATQSLGWTRYDNDAIRMGISYIYSRLLRKVSMVDILEEEEMKYIFDLIQFHTVEFGNGIQHDLIPIHHECVRSYYPLISIHRCLTCYAILFGQHVVNYERIFQSLQLATTDPYGITNPALNTTKPSFQLKSVIFEEEFQNGIFCAKSSKVLTMRTPNSFACIVGSSEQLAYYEADSTYDMHAALWAMNKRLHNRHQEVIDYTETSCKYESGLILFTVDGKLKVPSVIYGKSSFLPRIAKTVVLTLPEVTLGIMHSVSAFTELHNLRFKSLTILFENNLVQLYYNIYVDMTDVTNDPYLVALYLPPTYCDQESDIKGYNAVTCNGITALHMNIKGHNPFPDFQLTLHTSMDRSINQVVDKISCYEGSGTCCFRQIVAGTPDDYVYARYNSTNNSYSFRLLKDGKIHIVLGPKYLAAFNTETKNLRIANLEDGTVIESDDIIPTLKDLDLGTCKSCREDD